MSLPLFRYSASLFVMGLALSCLSPAHAASNDTKIIGAAGCHPMYPATASEVQFFMAYNGLINLTNHTVRIACPIVKDAFHWHKDLDGDAYTESGARLFYQFKAGGVPGRVSCTVYTSTPLKGVISTTNAPFLATPGNQANESMYLFDPIDIGGDHPSNLICTLDPQTTFLGFSVNEFEMTDL